jgi:alanyl aminopeptidase
MKECVARRRAATKAWLVAIAACIACSAPGGPRAPGTGARLVPPGLRLPDDAVPTSYSLQLDLDPEQPAFAGRVTIEVRILKPTDHVWLSADRLTFGKAVWQSEKASGALTLDPVQGDEMRAFRFGQRLEPGKVLLEIPFTGTLDDDSEEGLFRERAAGGGWYIFSQGESVFARRFTPCFDEPRFKTPWRVTLTVPKSSVALSNMPELSTVPLGERKEVTFDLSGPMPSYLVAIAVGPFDLVDVGKLGKAKIPVRVIVPKGDAKQAGVVAAKLPAVIDALESYIGEPVPLAKLDLVAVPHLFGAMENPGLVTFDAPMLIGDPKNSAFANNFVLVAAHELAHQWFGNSVTPAWWDDLWLSEGFASWLGNKIELQLGAVDDPELRAAQTRREAIAVDTGTSAAPLRRPMMHNTDPDNAFDEIAYQKAHVVLSTFEGFLGEEAFRDVLRAYAKAHVNGTATTADFIATLRTATNDATATSFDQYVRLTGVPVVEMTRECTTTNTVTMHARDGRIVPVCVEQKCALVGDQSKVELGASCAKAFGNTRAGYYHTAWLTHDMPKLDVKPARLRIVIGDDIAAAIERGELAAADAIAELRAMLDSGDPYSVLGGVAVANAIDRLVGDNERATWSAWLGKHVQGMRAGARELAEQLEIARLQLAPTSYGPNDVKDTLLAVDRQITTGNVSPILVAIAAPSGGDKLWRRIADRAKVVSEDQREDYYSALGVFGPGQAPLAVELLTDASIDIEDAWLAVEPLLHRPATRTATWRALRPVFPAVMKRLGADANELVDALGALCDKASRDEVANALKPGTSHFATTLASIDRCIASRAKLGDLAGALH